ncbi:MAG: hypothetical protein ABL908_13345 [Hyphomicrobium sp.]
MSRRTATAVVTLLIASPLWATHAGATEPPTPPPAASEPSTPPILAAGAEIAVACTTKAVVVATAAAKASNGPIELQLAATATTAGDAGPVAGTWRIASVGDTHQASFAATHRAVCHDGCPLSVQASGDIQLWAPKPNTLDKIADGEMLFVAVLKPATLALRASTFRGKDIEALEEGTCRKVSP